MRSVPLKVSSSVPSSRCDWLSLMWLVDDITTRVSCGQKAELEHDNMEINKKMDLQVASLKTVLESLKLETIRYLAGTPPVPKPSKGWLADHCWGAGQIECDSQVFLSCVAPQRRCSPAWPSLWESTGCGGEGSANWLVQLVFILDTKYFQWRKNSLALRSVDCCFKISQLYV